MPAIAVRELPPLRLGVTIAAPNGVRNRWGLDEPKADNVPNGLSFSSTAPGGFEAMTCTLPRKSDVAYSDMTPLSTVRVFGAGGQCAWEGRLESSPRVSGPAVQITPGAVGWQAHLADDNSAKMIYVDRDLTAWQEPSVARRLVLTSVFTGNSTFGVSPDAATGAPSLVQQITGAWAGAARNEAYYDAKGIPLGSIYYAWKINSNVNSADASWAWFVRLATDDVSTISEETATLRAAGPGTGTLSATRSDEDWAQVRFAYGAAAGDAGRQYELMWTVLAMYGNHGLTKRGDASATTAQGFYASDVVAHAVRTWAPLLDISTGVNGTVTDTSFVIPQLVFKDPTTASEIISGANRYHLRDWAVWESASPTGRPTFYYYDRGTRGKSWRARVAEARLEEAGPNIEHLFNGVIVRFQDVDGTIKTVGPTGSGCDTTSTSVMDPDPLNPATQAGIKRWAIIDMGGVSTPAGATEVGRRFIVETAQFNTAGRAALTGHVQDDRGVWYPAWRVRAGDTISFTDSNLTDPRRVVRTQYDDSSKTCSVDLDAPAEGLSALLERLQVSLIGIL